MGKTTSLNLLNVLWFCFFFEGNRRKSFNTVKPRTAHPMDETKTWPSNETVQSYLKSQTRFAQLTISLYMV